ncbi:MAG: molybdopterin-dependent oxidoreductase [Pseudomonadota bacterium]
MDSWHKTACMLCSINCGIEVKLGGAEGRTFEKIRGDKAHPSSQGYICQKATRLDHYQNGKDRVTQPLKRNSQGGFDPITWDVAIKEISERLKHIKEEHGGDKIFYYGGGGQGNHLPSIYAASTLSALGSIYRSNALAQEKTGEFWVQGRMFGSPIHGCFDDCDVAFFLGKNPWQSHGFPRTRNVLNEIAKDPNRKMIVVDPVRSETADKADVHLQLKPGTDAWLVSAVIALYIQNRWYDQEWVAQHCNDFDAVKRTFDTVSVSDYCKVAGVDEEQLLEAVNIMRNGNRLAFMEDLGIQMNRNSTLVSYLHRLMWVVTSSFAKPGSMNVFNPMHPLVVNTGKPPKRSPVVDAKVIYGLVPCNVVPEEILTDHPDQYRAMIVESTNPAHSLADSPKWRQALRKLECTVVIDIALTETAREADYVLPTPTQFEKWECSFFNLEPTRNTFHLRQPVLSPPDGVLGEPEIHSRLVEALDVLPEGLVDDLSNTLKTAGPLEFAKALQQQVQQMPQLMYLLPVVLYRTLGPMLPNGSAVAAPLWAIAHEFTRRCGDSVRQAGYQGSDIEVGQQLFEAILTSASGTVICEDTPESSWDRLQTRDKKINAAIPELLGLVEELSPGLDPIKDDYPLVLSAGERRAFTANTAYRDPHWRRKDFAGALRVSPHDAERLQLQDGGLCTLITENGKAQVLVEVSDRMQPGHVSLPNGQGLRNTDGEEESVVGVAPNELTSLSYRDFFAGTPWHKYVPARLETAS